MGVNASLVVVVLGLFVLAGLLAAGAAALQGEVSRARLERFARRQRLVITTGNGAAVLSYLGTTRRWRALGLITAVLASLSASLLFNGELSIQFLVVFLGWFAGAVIAEWRIARAPSSGTRRALLVPRRLADHLPDVPRYAAGLAFAVPLLAVAVGVVAVHTARERLVVLGWGVLTLAVAGALVLVARHVLPRPQVVGPPDVLAADEAIRSRSLHVLAGSAVALAGYLAAWIVDVLHEYTRLGDDAAAGLTLLCVVGAPVTGYLLATRSFGGRRGRAGLATVQ